MKKFLLILAFSWGCLGCISYEYNLSSTVSPASVKTESFGPSVVIREIHNLDPEPIEHLLAQELERGGYSVVVNKGDGYSNSPFDNEYWARHLRSGGNYRGECSACTRADYFIEVGARPIGYSREAGGVSFRRYGYGASGYGESLKGEVEIYLTFYDGRTGRAVPGKSSRARVSLTNYKALAGDIILRTLGFNGVSDGYTLDPATEAAVRVIPQMIQSEGQR